MLSFNSYFLFSKSRSRLSSAFSFLRRTIHNNTNDIAETKTYLYNYDYETDSNGEVSTAYNEEKPSVDANEPQITEEPIVKLNGLEC